MPKIAYLFAKKAFDDIGLPLYNIIFELRIFELFAGQDQLDRMEAHRQKFINQLSRHLKLTIFLKKNCTTVICGRYDLAKINSGGSLAEIIKFTN